MIRIKRVYDLPSPDDGVRILVDRLWPRGLEREAAAIHAWFKEIAPSHELRKWFGHEPARWPEFQARYQTELQNPVAASSLDELRRMAVDGSITLVFAARDVHMNNAEALREFLLSRMLGAKR